MNAVRPSTVISLRFPRSHVPKLRTGLILVPITRLLLLTWCSFFAAKPVLTSPTRLMCHL